MSKLCTVTRRAVVKLQPAYSVPYSLHHLGSRKFYCFQVTEQLWYHVVSSLQGERLRHWGPFRRSPKLIGEIRRDLEWLLGLLGRKVMTDLDSILKSRDITLPTKVHLVKVVVFPVVMDGCESWTVKKAEHRRIDAFEPWCWRRLLRVPWTARRSNQSILKEVSPGCSLEGLMLKLKLQYFGHSCEEWLTGKDPDAGRGWGQEEKGTTEDEMAGWHHRLDGHESE